MKDIVMRNIKLISIVLILFAVIFCSCNGDDINAVSLKKINGKKVLICDVDKITETKQMKLSQLVESSRLVQLSNNTEALMGNTWLQKSTLGYFVLADFHNKLFIFDNNGKYLNSWTQGQGPNEFILPSEPQVVKRHLYVKDRKQNKLLKYSITNQDETAIKLCKSTGKSIVLNDSTILNVGNSESNKDPFLIGVQNLKGKVLQSIKASHKVVLTPPLVQDKVICFATKSGWNIHFPENDTLMHYNYGKNELTPVAVFNSTKHIKNNKKLYEARKKGGLKISDRSLTQTIKVVPEYESSEYIFLSVYYYGLRKDLPWYFAERKMCLINKATQKAFFVNLIDDFLGDMPFTLGTNSKIWSKTIIKSYPVASLKSRFQRAINKNSKMKPEMKEKLQNIISNTNEDDNSVILEYQLK